MCHLCGGNYSRIIIFNGVREYFVFQIFCAMGKKLKHRRVGNECRLTRCPFVVSFVCLWSPVIMVYFILCLCRSFCCCRVVFLHLLPTYKYSSRSPFPSLITSKSPEVKSTTVEATWSP